MEQRYYELQAKLVDGSISDDEIVEMYEIEQSVADAAAD